jgi:thiopurine S-methyltransferase
MKADFWHNLWEKKQIGWHKDVTNPLLEKHYSKLSINKNRVFVPLCGKSLDIKWLLDKNFHVLGIELSELAVVELFEYLDLEAQKTQRGPFILYSAENIDIFVGDIFDLDKEVLGSIDSIYDRGAIVALPASMRDKYTRHLIEITNNASQLVICYDYDEGLMNGPPFSVNKSLLYKYYSENYTITLLETSSKGDFALDVDENIWLLEN